VNVFDRTLFYIFMWCRIFHKGSDLNIEIHKYLRWPRIFRSERTSKVDPLCKVSIKFDELWEHLASEAQQETNCELIFASIISHLTSIP